MSWLPAVSPMTALVCGSRGWDDEGEVRRHLMQLPTGCRLIHGGARGADRLAGRVGAEIGLRVREFPADWDRYGKRAGILRNIEMLDERPDLVIAFQLEGSRGTQHTIDEARRRGIRTVVVTDPDA